MASSDYHSNPRLNRPHSLKVVPPSKAPLPRQLFRGKRVPREPSGGDPHQDQQTSQPFPPPTTSRTRLLIVWGILMAGGLGLAINLFKLQVVKAPELQQRAQAQQRVRMQPFVPRRPITDRNGNILAIDRPVYTLYAHPKLFKATKYEIAAKLVPLLVKTDTVKPLTSDAIVKLLNRGETGIRVADSVTEEIANHVTNLGFDGLELVQHPQRIYPQQDLAADAVGYVDNDLKGQAGVEYSQQNLLQRTMPSLWFNRAMKGVLVPEKLAGGFIQYDDLHLKLTLDSRLQRAARTTLKQQIDKYKGKRGMVIVMDVHTGALLSLVTEPSYNPNQYFNFPVSRFKNWALTDVYEPGSTFKPINVAIALESGAVKADDIFVDEGMIFVEGWPIANYDYERGGARGPLSVTDILKYSSNVGMVRIMQQVKPEVFYDSLKRLGLGETTGIDLPFEVPSMLKNREQFIISPVERATTAFGQGFSLTPIQMARLHATLANGGKLVTPHVVEGLFDGKGQPYWEMRLPPQPQIFSPETTRQVLAMMEKVVSEGTGKAAQIPGYRIAGKTGTAQKVSSNGGYSSANIVSFVGIVPEEAPRYVVLAVVDEPQGGSTGGVVAAPIVKAVMESLIGIEKVPPSVTPENQPTPPP